jgi:hypothetical protein
MKPNSYLNEFIEYVSSQWPLYETKSLFRHVLYSEARLAFYFTFAIKIFNVSCNRINDENCRSLVEEAARQLVEDHMRNFVEHLEHYKGVFIQPNDHAEILMQDLAEPCAELRIMVEHMLFEDARTLFAEAPLEVMIGKIGLDEQHPMRTFARYLDHIEYLRKADPKAYRDDAVRFRNVATLRRVGLAVLPPETWRPRITLATANAA